MAHRKTEKESPGKRESREERRLDEEIEESFPASDPPSYAAGGAAIGEPRRPKQRKPTA
jgi:hypothetical protein